jgi:hypothetical protein
MRLGIILPYSLPIYSSVWQEVDLPSQLTEARLSLYYFPGGWPEDADIIYLRVTRANDGTVLFSQNWMEWEQAWHLWSANTAHLTASLLPCAGQRIRVRIGLRNIEDGMTAVYLDDVELWVTGSGFAPGPPR